MTDWRKGMTVAELAVADAPEKATEAQILAIIDAGQTQPFGDYHPFDIIIDLINRGVIEIDPTKGPSRATTMAVTIWARRKEVA